MTLYEKIKQAVQTDATNEQIANIFGVSVMTVRKTREVVYDLERAEHPERFDAQGIRKEML